MQESYRQEKLLKRFKHKIYSDLETDGVDTFAKSFVNSHKPKLIQALKDNPETAEDLLLIMCRKDNKGLEDVFAFIGNLIKEEALKDSFVKKAFLVAGYEGSVSILEDLINIFGKEILFEDNLGTELLNLFSGTIANYYGIHLYDSKSEIRCEPIESANKTALLIDAGVDPNTALSKAKRYNFEIEKYRIFIHIKDTAPIVAAVQNGGVSIVDTFIEAGAKLEPVNIMMPWKSYTYTNQNRLEMTDFLMSKGVDVTYFDEFEGNILHKAMHLRGFKDSEGNDLSLKILNEVIKKTSDQELKEMLLQQDNEGMTPMHYALAKQFPETTDFLLDQYEELDLREALSQIKDKSGHSVMDLLSYYEEILEDYREYGLKGLDIKCDYGGEGAIERWHENQKLLNGHMKDYITDDDSTDANTGLSGEGSLIPDNPDS